mmetsp:Transcript_3511/g.8949  ORF Transcript_3511/g.8949 Transcript_3511/m.8949 type:complete len:97 (-) Transcript_3511:694-984(-)
MLLYGVPAQLDCYSRKNYSKEWKHLGPIDPIPIQHLFHRSSNTIVLHLFQKTTLNNKHWRNFLIDAYIYCSHYGTSLDDDEWGISAMRCHCIAKLA